LAKIQPNIFSNFQIQLLTWPFFPDTLFPNLFFDKIGVSYKERFEETKSKQAIARVLEVERPEFIAGFPSNPLFESVVQEGIWTIQTRTERVAVNMADGFTRASFGERNGVAVMKYGPGIENAFSGIAHAYADSLPILLLVCQ